MHRHRLAVCLLSAAALLGATGPAAATVAGGPLPAAATATTTTLASSSAQPPAGVAVTFTATVSPRPGGGTVAFSTPAGSIPQCNAVPVSSAGVAGCRAWFTGTGRVVVMAKYSGTTGFAASTGRRAVTVQPRQPALVGGVGSCTATTGALVAVDFGPWHPKVARGCGLSSPTGYDLLHDAGFTTVGDQHDGPGFICRLGSPRVANGTQYPTPAADPCVVTPPATASWSYWVAAAGSNTWQFSTVGAMSHQPQPGEIEVWVYGGVPVGTSTPVPTFRPNQARAGLPGLPAASSTDSVSGVEGIAAIGPHQATGSNPDLGAAARYVATATSPAGQPGGTSLAANGYLQSFPGSADFGLTIDGALALAATGSDDAALRTVVDFVNDRRADAGGRTVDDWTGVGSAYASGGSVAKEALLAEVTGFDPHAFGGHDLIATLAGLVCPRTDNAHGCAAAGGYTYASSVFAQATGVLAQLRAGDTAAAAPAVRYLESLQHADGSFPSLVPASTDSDVDSTAMAATALSLVPADTTAVSRAVAWVAGQQRSDGGFDGTSGNSTNSAGLALLALHLRSGNDASIARTLAFLAGVQNSDGGFPVAAGSGPSDLRAGTQVLSGLVGTSLATLTRDVTGQASGSADAAAAARWLVSQLVDGTHLEYAGGFGPNYGGTADAAFSLAAAGGQDTTLRAVVAYLGQHAGDYADPDGTGRYPGPYSGQVAKLALLAEVVHTAPTDFGGFDLLHTLTANVCTAGDDTGGCTAPGDFYQAFSSISQSLGVLALARAHVDVPAAAVTRLRQLQCADGGFSSDLIAPGADCTSDPDATAYAVQALVLLPSAATAVDRAVVYLRADQGDDGGYTGTAGVNTNTTAVATMALLATGVARTDGAVQAAEAFLGARQNSDGGLGISSGTPASDALATGQAIPAIVGLSLTTLDHSLAGGGGSSAPGGTPTPSSSGGLATTGVDSAAGLSWGLVCVLAGAALCAAAGWRRRSPAWHRG